MAKGGKGSGKFDDMKKAVKQGVDKKQQELEKQRDTGGKGTKK
jgi:hypothetical protein